MFQQFEETLTFDDVLLVPQKSDILPNDADLRSLLTKNVILNVPFLSSPMDTVTEHAMAIAMALSGGMGVIHKNLSIEKQADEVRMVKRFENGFIEDPVTVNSEELVSRVIDIRTEYGYKKVPVVDQSNVLVGLITDVDYSPSDDKNLMVKFRMRPVSDMVVAKHGISLGEANKMIRKNRLSTLCVVDSAGKLVSIVTHRDIEKNEQYPNACKNSQKQLRVAGAIGVGDTGLLRAEALIDAGVDVLVVDTAHGHSAGVIETVKALKKKWKEQAVIAGNIASSKAAIELIAAGADALKVGIGPGSICTTRIISGVGVPQLSAILDVAKGVKSVKRKVPIIADGGITSSGDIVKALAAGASAVMMGNMFAGTDEAPGRVEFVNGRMYKVYRGMGSLDAMEAGGKERYRQTNIIEKKKLVPEGVSGRVPYKGPVSQILYQLAGGLRSGMGYCGAKNITQLQKNAHFVRITGASLKESHPHDLDHVDSAPNYAV